MKGLIKYLAPFAPDQSGATGVLYGLGGLLVVCDAGGCTGNICGFDEPRWFLRQNSLAVSDSSTEEISATARGSAYIENTGNSTDASPGIILSAGLRDMDAILGRDEQLIAKLQLAVKQLGSPFAALIGTPVPAVIGTDYAALRRMAEKRCGLPILGLPCTGTGLYDEGEEIAYLSLFKRFLENRTEKASPSFASAHKASVAQPEIVPGRLGILGATPLNLSTATPSERLRKALGTNDLLCYGASGGLAAIALAPTVEKNLVVAPSGLAAAKYLQKRFGTPYEVACPLLPEDFAEKAASLAGKRVLILHQQVLANEARKVLATLGCTDVTVATFFRLEKELSNAGDLHLTEEGDLADLLANGGFEAVIGDRYLSRCCRTFAGEWLHLPHFAVSGECADI